MSNNQQPDRDDQDRVELQRAYRAAGAQDEPPPALDDAIRAAARRAVQAGPQGSKANKAGKPGFLRRYQFPLAAAATVLLSTSLLLVVMQDQPAVLKSPQAEPAAAPILPLTIQEKKMAPEPMPPTAPASGSSQVAKVEIKPAETLIVPVPEVSMSKPAVPLAADIRAKNAANEMAAQRARESRREIAETAPGSNSDIAVQSRARSDTPPPPASPAAAAAAPAYAPPAEVIIAAPGKPQVKSELAKADNADKNDKTVASKDAAERIIVTGSNISNRDKLNLFEEAKPAPAAAPAAQGAVVTAPPAAASAPAPVAARMAVAPPVYAAPKAVTIAPQASAPAAPPPVEAPGPWIKRMQELRDAGKLKELRAELERFKKAHPDVVLPKSLTELPPE